MSLEVNNSDILFLPLDLPLISNKKTIIDNFFSKEKEDYVWWNMDIILGERNVKIPLGSKEYHWSQKKRSQYESIIQAVEQSLPFKTLYYVHLSSAHKEVLPHVDENYEESPFSHHMTITSQFKSHLNENEPIGYRAIINGKRDNLYCCDNYDSEYKVINYNKKIYCEIPETTDFFLIRNSLVPHGVDQIQNDKDRLTLFILGEVDQERHNKLIKRSMRKYSHKMLHRNQLFGNSHDTK